MTDNEPTNIVVADDERVEMYQNEVDEIIGIIGLNPTAVMVTDLTELGDFRMYAAAMEYQGWERLLEAIMTNYGIKANDATLIVDLAEQIYTERHALRS